MNEATARDRGPRFREAERNDAALLTAARQVFGEQGLGASVQAVAEQAKMGVAGLYRRFPTKQALLQHLCVAALHDTTSLALAAADIPCLRHGLRTFIIQSVERRCGAFAGVGRIALTTAEMQTAFLDAHRAVRDLTSRAHAQGMLRKDVNELDILHLVELFSRGSESPSWARSLGIAIDGLLTSNPAPLSGTKPNLHAYAQRWQGTDPNTQT